MQEGRQEGEGKRSVRSIPFENLLTTIDHSMV